MKKFNGLGMSLGNLSLASNAQTRSISSENRTGTKGGGGKDTPEEAGRPGNPARNLGRG